jgi:hypothetical protein
MTTTHTPGPWTAAEQFDGDESLGIAVSARRQEIVRIYDIGGEGFANARLIAAAPDLLAALRGVVLCADARGDAEPLDAYQTRAAMLPGQIARAYAAIARATGADA